MSIEEFINGIDDISVNSELVAEIEGIYEISLSDYLGKILSFNAEGYFFGNNKRLLSINEIKTAEEDLHVCFKLLKMLPLFDTGDNDFVVYSFEDNTWKLFNIIDKCDFYQSADLKSLLLI